MLIFPFLVKGDLFFTAGLYCRDMGTHQKVYFSAILVAMVIGAVVPETDDRSDWLDPNDMINFDPSTGTMDKNPKVMSIEYFVQ